MLQPLLHPISLPPIPQFVPATPKILMLPRFIGTMSVTSRVLLNPGPLILENIITGWDEFDRADPGIEVAV